MLDEFNYGGVNRISPESASPVIGVYRQETMIGAAGNVSHNIVQLGGQSIFIGMVGEDEAGRKLMNEIAGVPGIECYVLVDRTRLTTRKIRFVSEHHSTHLLRADWEQPRRIDADLEKTAIDRALAVLPRVQAVVLSDYAKGMLTPHIMRTIIDAARKQGTPVVVDPKGSDYAK